MNRLMLVRTVLARTVLVAAACVGLLVCCSMHVSAEPPERSKQAGLLDSDNLVAWCIVPFDAKKRGPAERAEMIKRLGLQRVAYDWRAEHVATFEQEIQEYQRRGIDYFAFGSWHDAI